MKVRTLKRILNNMEDNEEICVLWYEQKSVDEYTGNELTNSEWQELCEAFDEADGDGVFDDNIIDWMKLMVGTIIGERTTV